MAGAHGSQERGRSLEEGRDVENNPPCGPFPVRYMHVKDCPECGQSFEPVKPWQQFCSGKCRDNFHNKRRANKSPPKLTETGGQMGQSITRSAAHLTRRCKLFNVLAALARGQSFNRFQAERDLHDHVLPSTIQGIEKRGIVVSRKAEIVPGFAGSKIHTVRYSLTQEEQEKAAKILEWRTWRGPA